MANYFNAKQSKVDIWELRLSVDKVISFDIGKRSYT
jgi:hypothetical protein